MKKIQIILFILFCGSIYSQNTLTAVSSVPLLGDIFKVAETTSLNPGSAGANVTWNFSSLNISQTITINCNNVSSASHPANFPSASIALMKNGNSKCYSSDNTKLSFYGGDVANPNLIGTYYGNPEEVLHFPFTYLNSFTDSWNGATDITPNPMLVDQIGTTTVTADAYGTIITPAGTFSNVIRVHTSRVWIDTLQSPAYLNSSSGNYYAWYSTNYRCPVLEIWNVAGNPNFSGSGSRILLSQTVGLKKNYANSNEFHYSKTDNSISVTSPDIEAFKIILFDIQGNRINEENFFNNKAEIKNLNDQLYLVLIVDKNGNYLQIKKIL